MLATPLKQATIPRSTSDVSMGSAADMLESPPNRGIPDIKALADALEPPPDMFSLKVWVQQSLTQHAVLCCAMT